MKSPIKQIVYQPASRSVDVFGLKGFAFSAMGAWASGQDPAWDALRQRLGITHDDAGPTFRHPSGFRRNRRSYLLRGLVYEAEERRFVITTRYGNQCACGEHDIMRNTRRAQRFVRLFGLPRMIEVAGDCAFLQYVECVFREVSGM